MKRGSIVLFFAALLSLIALQAPAQVTVKNYDQQWKNVEDFSKKNLPKSALAEVKNIYTQAKKDKQDAQVIKSLIYMTTLQMETRENNEILSINDVEKEITADAGKEPVASILNSLLASMYWNYYQNHRWELLRRTETLNFKKEDIATWSAGDFHKKISTLFLLSLKEEKLLQQTKLVPYDAIITKGNMRHLRPTLFDLLSHIALSYFQNDERDVANPSYAFEINQASAFDPAADFITRKFPTADTLSLFQKALLLYQKLIAFHLNDTKPDALIDVDIKRIQFVYSRSTHPDKENLYMMTLNHIAHQYENLPAAAEAWHLIAEYYNTKASQYKPYGDSTHRLDRVKAKEICQRVIAQKDSSEGKIGCINLLNEINQPALQFSMEKVNVPAQASRVLVTYKNIGQVYLRLIKPDDNIRKQMENQYQETYWSALANSTAIVKTWEQALPVVTDLLTHTTELKVDALPAGDYVLLVSNNKNFARANSILGARMFYVSTISFVNNGKDYFLLNRESGQPLTAASVQVWEQKYDYKASAYIKEKKGLYKTDANGFFKIQQSYDENKRPLNNPYQLEITYGKEKLFMNEMLNNTQYYGEYINDTKPFNRIFLFADRSIYRPGQTLYFKGITMRKDNQANKSDILTGYETMVYLHDANGQKIDSAKVTTNDYGSFSGKFQLPESGLNGQFTLHTKNEEGYLSFAVEEYKRPKFYVDYESLKGTYKVNDSITVTGLAKAYAGNNVDGAMVKYRVVRQPRYIYYWMFSKSWQPPTAPLEISHGEIKTDKDGKFTVKFMAIPDKTIDKKLQPVFDYTVYADVTDINGETRSGEKLVTVSYKSLLLQTNIPASISIDSLKKLSIRTENMNGEFEPAIVKVTFTKLKEEKRLIRERFWDRPDQFIYTKDEYIRNFPYDEYDNETDPSSWVKGEKVFEKTDSARINGQFAISNGQWTSGYYMIEVVTKDKNGEEVKDVKYIQLDDEKSNQLSKPQYLWAAGPDGAIEPGQSTSVKLGTSADNLFVIQDIDKARNYAAPVHNYSFIKLNQEKRNIQLGATEADRGGYGSSWLFVKNNRVYQYNQIISVPWTNKELSIEYATYRDKTLPGSEEKWKVKISGYKNEKVAAEMLASMYDASLDQFAPHSWSQPGIWLSYYRYGTWNANDNFLIANGYQRRWTEPAYKALIKDYDQTIYERNNSLVAIGYGSVKNMVIRGLSTQRAEAAPLAYAQIALDDKATAYRGNYKKADTAEFLDVTLVDGTAISPDKQTGNVQQDQTVQVRKNFNETAFFFPDLRTDSSGAIEFSFTLPEALTKWKFQAMAHTKDLAFGYSTKDIVTQKELMVQPNAPRFLREGDKMEFSAKIVNLSDKEVTGQAELQLVDATTNQSVDGWFKNIIPNQFFTVAAGQSEAIKFPIEIPYRFSSALVWRIVAKAGAISDGEENSLPVLTNRMLVTETLPLWMRGTGIKNFTFDKLLKSGNSETLQQHALTVEYTSNPAWYAVQALPYLMEYPYECAEQTWNRYYANSLATFIANSSPRIKQIFEKWKITDTAALMSNLQKNQELKAVLLEETPWVMQAKTETQQKKNIALLFDMIRMSKELSSAFDKLKQMQSSNGGFVWFNGGPDDRYMTQYIVTGIGHLKRLNSISAAENEKLKTILNSAIPYLDKKIKEDYDALVKNKTDLTKYTPGYSSIQYLYMRSFFPEYKIVAASQTAYNYFRGRIQKTWTQQNKYMQGMIVLALGRTGDATTPAAILKSLKETSITSEELGMYWKDASRSWWWYEAPIERQALLIEAFEETGKDTKTADDLRTWLLKNKQTNNWETTKATAEACYALLLKGTQWLTNEPDVQIKLGSTVIKTTDQQEAGTGYIKQTIQGEKVNPGMGNISVTIAPTQTPTTEPSWGTVYWQYFEDLDKITTAATPLNLVKKLFVETNTDRGPVLTPVTDQTVLKVGDKIKVRIELRADRDMEYVHMKDMRASCLEPVNVLSNYKYQGGLGYYESTKDASTNFFFSNLRKGTYVFEYPLFVSHTGNFSNGVTSIQCMYAPEFAAHSEGVRITVEK